MARVRKQNPQEQIDELVEVMLRSPNEEDVRAAIERIYGADVWSDIHCQHWTHLGGEDSAGTTSAQQARPEMATRELGANGLDAVLNRLIRENPRAFDGHLGSNRAAWARAQELELLSPDLLLISLVGGLKGQSAGIVLMDRGEGQSHEKFQENFLSVSQGSQNKRHATHLMGRYGMGSTGCHAFAGNYGLRLIISRRSTSEPWGVALVRKRQDPKQRDGLEWFSPDAGSKPHAQRHVPTIAEKNIRPLRFADGSPWMGTPEGRKRGLRFDSSLSRGTVVKLFSYDSIKSSGYDGLREELNRGLAWLPPMAYLINLNYRFSPDGELNPNTQDHGGADPRPFNGLEASLMEKIKGETGLSCSFDVPHGDSFLRVRSILIPEETVESSTVAALGASRVYHVLAGQIQGEDSKTELRNIGLGEIASRLFVFCDATNLPPNAIGAIFHGARENLVRNNATASYRESLFAGLRDQPALLAWKVQAETERRARDESGVGGADIAGEAKALVSASGARHATTRAGRGVQAARNLSSALNGPLEAQGANAGFLVSLVNGLPDGAITRQGKKNGKKVAKTSGVIRGTIQTGAAVKINMPKKTKTAPIASGSLSKAILHDGPDLDLAWFSITGLSEQGDETCVTIALREELAREAFAHIAGQSVIFTLSLLDQKGSSISVEAKAPWVSLDEQGQIDAEGAGSIRTTRRDPIHVVMCTADGRELGSPQPKGKGRRKNAAKPEATRKISDFLHGDPQRKLFVKGEALTAKGREADFFIREDLSGGQLLIGANLDSIGFKSLSGIPIREACVRAAGFFFDLADKSMRGKSGAAAEDALIACGDTMRQCSCSVLTLVKIAIDRSKAGDEQ